MLASLFALLSSGTKAELVAAVVARTKQAKCGEYENSTLHFAPLVRPVGSDPFALFELHSEPMATSSSAGSCEVGERGGTRSCVFALSICRREGRRSANVCLRVCPGAQVSTAF
jgi:hypothetical protein